MTKQEALAKYGTHTALAEALGVTRSAVSQWRTIPLGRQLQLEQITGGELKAESPVEFYASQPESA